MCDFLRNQGAIRAKDGYEPTAPCMAYEVEDVRTHQRLAARKNHNLKTRACNFIKKFFPLLCRELFGRLTAGIAVAMGTVHIAGIRRIPRYNIHIQPSVSPISSSVR